jgi:hypothetical protein
MHVHEKQLIDKLLAPTFSGRDELKLQLQNASVATVDENGSLEFFLKSDISADHVKYVVPTEGEYEDTDGVTVHILLHVVRGKAKELELYKEDNSQVIKWPDPECVRVFAPE